jgi:hypothetical protein
MDATTPIRPRDVISYLGRDYLVEGVLSYRLSGKVHKLARAADGDVVIWMEPLTDDLDDRVLMFSQVTDLDIATPPPASISYRGSTFLLRLSGRAQVEIAGRAPDRAPGPRELWRYRAAGDVYLQIEAPVPAGGSAAGAGAAAAGGTVILHGESVHKGMIEVLPGR